MPASRNQIYGASLSKKYEPYLKYGGPIVASSYISLLFLFFSFFDIYISSYIARVFSFLSQNCRWTSRRLWLRNYPQDGLRKSEQKRIKARPGEIRYQFLSDLYTKKIITILYYIKLPPASLPNVGRLELLYLLSS